MPGAQLVRAAGAHPLQAVESDVNRACDVPFFHIQVIGPSVDIPSSDIGTAERHMAWMFDQYSKINGFSPACVTGKPLWLHGSYGRDSGGGKVRSAGLHMLDMCRKIGAGNIPSISSAEPASAAWSLGA